MPKLSELHDLATQTRRDILRMTNNAKCGHPGGSLGCADFLTILYNEVMEHQADPFKMDGIGEDLFFLSNGHICPLWYSVLARTGYFEVEELGTFRKINSRLQGHPATAEGLPGVRIASGSLGQGLSVAIGAALSKKLNQDSRLVYSLHGDGELQEGQNWEAIMYAGNNKVDNLIATVDLNGKQIDGPVDEINSLGDIKAKWEAFKWKVYEMNGNDMEEVMRTLEQTRSDTGNGYPIVIIMRTIMSYPIDFMMDDHAWHGVAPDDEQLEKALAQLPETIGDY